jgi:hypothetical protein
MIVRKPSFQTLSALLTMLLLASILLEMSVASTPPRVLYIYGDVSEDGQVPSGGKAPFHQMRLNDTGDLGMSQFKEAIEAVGIRLEEAYDADVELTDSFLASYQAIILGSNQRRFTAAEAASVKKWVEAGGGVIAWSDSAFGGHFGTVGIANTLGRDSDNDLIQQFGMFMLTDNGGGNYLISEYTEPHYLNDNQMKGALGFRGEGVSPIRVSSPARMLAPLQEGGLGGKLKVNAIDEPFNAQTDAALAIAEIGKGRVVATFDRNTFWNAGAGTRLSQANNREFAQRLVLWAAQREETPLPDSATSTRPTGKVTVHAGPDRTIRQGETAHLAGSVKADGNPEILWRVTRGPAEAVSFENNNAAALDNRATFQKPGTYILELEGTLGKTKAVDQVKITVTE